MSVDSLSTGQSAPIVESSDGVADYLDRHIDNLSLMFATHLTTDREISRDDLSIDTLYHSLKSSDVTREEAAELQGLRMLRVLYNNARRGKHGNEGGVNLPTDDEYMVLVDKEMYRYIGRFVTSETGLSLPEYTDLPSGEPTQICKIGSYAVERGGIAGSPYIFYTTSADQA